MRCPELELTLVRGEQAIESHTLLKNYAFTKISEMIIDIDMGVRIEVRPWFFLG